ncbi:zinc finger protein 526 isoform X2 [Gouania willdenowi]|uniref:zinc finger protein 526 isoform X2 n=1 Tax=Gouania willdenowi TaxID=441366 RepID=UPI001056818E|nr:zinc finger protein 526-like isoform X2 [Gouania willdenowi]
MSELESLIVDFQAQLSEVMETAVKTAMFEVRRRDQELEALRLQLQWTEREHGDDGGAPTGKCGSVCGDTAAETAEEDNPGISFVKNEEESLDDWISSCKEEKLTGSSQSSHSKEKLTEEEEGVGIKEEDVETPLHLGVWSRKGQEVARRGASGTDAAHRNHSDTGWAESQVRSSPGLSEDLKAEQEPETSQRHGVCSDVPPTCSEPGSDSDRGERTDSQSLVVAVNVRSEMHKRVVGHPQPAALQCRTGASVRLQASTSLPQRAPKRLVHMHSNSSAVAPPLTTLCRLPSTSKAPPPPAPPSAVTLHPRLQTAATWPDIKSHHPAPPPDTHARVHAGPRHFLRCGQCGKCFSHPSNLKAHLHIHTGERPFCCSLCGRTFTKHSNLKAHRRVHTGERPYCCQACGKRFTQKCNLKRHQRIHLDV